MSRYLSVLIVTIASCLLVVGWLAPQPSRENMHDMVLSFALLLIGASGLVRPHVPAKAWKRPPSWQYLAIASAIVAAVLLHLVSPFALPIATAFAGGLALVMAVHQRLRANRTRRSHGRAF